MFDSFSMPPSSSVRKFVLPVTRKLLGLITDEGCLLRLHTWVPYGNLVDRIFFLSGWSIF